MVINSVAPLSRLAIYIRLHIRYELAVSGHPSVEPLTSYRYMSIINRIHRDVLIGTSPILRLFMQIDVFSDTVCPWCRIGKRHLELALADWTGEPVTVRYRSFFLDPNIPAEGRDFKAHMTAKGGGRIPLEQFFDTPRQRGAAVGLTFNFEDIEKAPNTMLSHRLAYLTPEARRGEMLDALYAAYFEHGRDIGDTETLIDIAR